MAWDVAAVIIALASLCVALVAIGRDAPRLRIRASEPAAGSFYMTVVNVGLRAVRIERIGFTDPSRSPWGRSRWGLRDVDYTIPVWPLAGRRVDHIGTADSQRAQGDQMALPVILDPGYDVVVQCRNEDLWTRFGGSASLVVEDAADNLYVAAIPSGAAGWD